MSTVDFFEMLSENLYMLEAQLEETENSLSTDQNSVNNYVLRQQKDRLIYQIDTIKFLIVDLAERAAKEKCNGRKNTNTRK